MSADRWTECPRCARRELAAIERRQAEAANAYGKVPMDAWKKLDDAARLIPQPETTLREDWEIGVHEDRLIVGYSGHCGTCGLKITFNHDQQIEGLDQ